MADTKTNVNTENLSSEQLITEHLDIWTTAIEQKSSAGRGSSKKFSLHGIKKLRELILELAVRGKLVPQDPNDEPASVLLERIAAEKAQLVKDKKIKKQKPLPEISEDEKPFELPESWEWVRFPDTSYYGPGKTPSTKNADFWAENSVGIPWVSIADLNDVGYVSETNKQVTQLAKTDIFKREPVPKGTLLMSFKLTVGKVSFLEMPAFHNEAIISIFPYSGVSKDYLFRVLPNRANKGNKKNAVMGFTLNSESLSLLVVPIPPEKEQHRIVAKVDELMSLCDALEAQTENSITAHQTLVEVLLEALLKAPEQGATPEQASAQLQQNWQRLSEHFDTLFTTTASIDTLKQTILQLAVMGKLVPQNPNDEPAANLLERIAAEKAQLIKDKKIKKQKPLPEITDEEKPFELPNGWEWCRLPDLGELARGKSKHRPRNDPKLYKNGTIPLVQTGDVARSVEVIETYTAMYNEVGLAQSQLWPKGTLCITIAANIADTGILGFDACFPDSVVGYTCFEDQIPTKYFDYFIRTAKANLEKFAPSTAQKNINLEILSQVLVPCPPLEEFERVVNKVDELMTLCDQLKARLTDAQTTKLHLTDAIVEQII
ncbi:restriction endonuclease subunit S [Pseudoalteromonas sp. SCQQ13]|uniref:restriction endonuclease subunit S n=1 Tax=Pseudoalteromonas sp. SCQQ13 TaxID=2792066 RepID=UPI0018CE8A8F|nr:restriction endonuclease subunit S [Pseudoalteromonas sp. SCQQ13]MBH0092843.1 restriction endonuclease subunit S [Pseudoalteromonas sp. SCQQ13]